MNFDRRSFIRNAALLSAGNALGLRPFGGLNALAQSGSGYKALVCLFLFGGNDANNTVIPYDAAGYANYANIRGGLAVPQNALLPLSPSPNFALHPSMPEMQALYNSNKMAIVANVGTLVQPTTRASLLAGNATLPSNLFSHFDQQLEWQNDATDALAPTGWAGRIADALTTQYNPGGQIPMVTSIWGDSLFADGASTSPVSVTPGSLGSANCSEGSECSARSQAAQQLVSFSSGLSLVQADNAITSNAYTYAAALASATSALKPLQTVFPATAVGLGFSQVAQLIQARSALNVQRQIYFLSAGGFDFHSNQYAGHAVNLAIVSGALGAFYQALVEMGVQNEVTVFTASEFNRAFQPNSAAGTDHAWGSHHLVLGGAVQGGKIYGTFPTLALGGPDDADTSGRWVPSTAMCQYAATLASWYGVPASGLSGVFPNLGNFSVNNLGFV